MAALDKDAVKPLTQMARIKAYEAEINACADENALASVTAKVMDDFELTNASNNVVNGFLKQKSEALRAK